MLQTLVHSAPDMRGLDSYAVTQQCSLLLFSSAVPLAVLPLTVHCLALDDAASVVSQWPDETLQLGANAV